MDKNKVRNLFVRFVSCISSIKEKSEEESNLLGLIGAIQTSRDKILHVKGKEFTNSDRELIYLTKQIEAIQIRLEIVSEHLKQKISLIKPLHESLVLESYVGFNDDRLEFLLPYHLTTYQRTLVPAFNSMSIADVDTIIFKPVTREIDPSGQGKYLVYPTMGIADFGTPT